MGYRAGVGVGFAGGHVGQGVEADGGEDGDDEGE